MRLAHCRLLDTNPPWVARPIGHGGAGMTLEAMIHHTQAVKRGASRPLVITNTPFGRCEGSPCEAPKNAQHLVKEGGAGCVQVEGPSEGGKERAETTTTIVDGGIAVAGHIGLRSQHTKFGRLERTTQRY
ncbi:hypothetical protein PRIC2_014676 [Phytophthora ramorum]